MHILFVTTEVAGIFKIGGLADVSLSLPVALSKEGVHVTVTLPFYTSISPSGIKGVGELAVDFAGKREIVFLFEKKLETEGPRLLLFRHPRLNDYHAHPMSDTFAFYSKVISTFYQYSSLVSKMPFDIVHCHDWHTAVIPLLLGEVNKVHHQKETLQSKSVKTIVTIHNLLYHGVAQDSIIADLSAPRDVFHINDKKVSFLREGFEYADCITTVSPTYAMEIISAAHHDSIGDVLQRRKDRVTGILNGIDPELWKPSFTSHTAATIKPKLKSALQKEVGLPPEAVPLYGFVGRIEPHQKGIDIVIGALEALLDQTPMQVVILGTGEETSERLLSELSKKHKSKLAFINAFDEKQAIRIYAASDILLVPSKFEPCGLTQMIAMRYGTIPLVRKTGGLADSVHDGVTGLVFDGYSVSDLTEAIKRAQKIWLGDSESWQKLMQNVMKEDFSWGKSAKEYLELYSNLKK
jgi:starch synthase